MKDIKVGVEKMTRNCRKVIEQTGDSLLLSKHSIQLSALFLLLSDHSSDTLLQLIQVFFDSDGMYLVFKVVSSELCLQKKSIALKLYHP